MPRPCESAAVVTFGSDHASPDATWRRYIGRLNGEPISSVSLFVTGADVGAYWPRGGAQGSRRQCCRAQCAMLPPAAPGWLAVLHATDQATGVYERLGFKPCTSIAVSALGRRGATPC